MKKKERIELAKLFAEEISGKSMIFVDYEGITMPQIDEIRNDIRENGARLKVFKNTLLKVSLGMANSDIPLDQYEDDCFKGMTGVVYVEEEQFSASGKKILKAEKNNIVKIKGGIYENKYLNDDSVRLYGSIPSKEELYGALVGCLDALLNQFVIVLDEVKSKKEESSG